MRHSEIVKVTPFRRRARALERRWQAALDANQPREPLGLPYWAQGVRVQRAGRFLWAVVATENAGH